MKVIDNLILLFIVWPIGIFLGLIFTLLRCLGRIKIINWQRFPARQKNLIVVANHPSFLEPVLLPLLFFPEYLKDPFSVPWSTPDSGLMKILFWLKSRVIAINRAEVGSLDRVISFRKMIKVLQNGGRIILFPEAGRTFKQKKWCFSQKGKKIGVLSKGVIFLAIKTKALVLPVWVDGAEDALPNNKFPFPRFWRAQVKIKIGQPLNITSREEVDLDQVLLSLADEE